MRPTTTAGPAPLSGVTLMVIVALTIPAVDAMVKLLAASYAPAFIAWARYTATLAFFVPFVLWREGKAGLWPRDLGAHAIRTCFMVGAMVAFVAALAVVPITTALGGLFLSPVIAAALAVFFLRERASWQRIAAVLVGFTGAMAVLQPGTALPLGGLWALLAGTLWAGYVICARLTGQGRDSSLVALTAQTALAALVLAPFALWQWPPLDATALVLILAIGLVSGSCHLLMLEAYRRSEASELAPLMYLELVTATLLGFALFGDWPNGVAWVGMAFVIAAGLAVHRQRA
ncbi:MAG: DMT family transporter [Geminicoccaceae bacterium]|nr:MAG: DMT family transporter [Geminicoccaceae bacterium]